MIEDLLKKASIKNTKQRYIILSIIKSSRQPLTAEELYKRLLVDDIKINLSTVYRTLNIMSDKNILLKVLKGDGTAAYQLNALSHNHYITCNKCNKSVVLENCPLNELSKDVSKETGFKVTGHSLQLTGICEGCLKK